MPQNHLAMFVQKKKIIKKSSGHDMHKLSLNVTDVVLALLGIHDNCYWEYHLCET